MRLLFPKVLGPLSRSDRQGYPLPDFYVHSVSHSLEWNPFPGPIFPMTPPKKPFSMRLIPRNRHISRTVWTIATVLGLGLSLASCHREACPGQITQDQLQQEDLQTAQESWSAQSSELRAQPEG